MLLTVLLIRIILKINIYLNKKTIKNENFTDENARSIIYKSLFAIGKLTGLGILRETVRQFLPSQKITSTVSRIFI